MTTNSKMLTIDEVIQSLGGFGTWQLLIYAYWLWNAFIGAAINMSIVFLEYSPKATCVVPEIDQFNSSQIQQLSSILTSNSSECQRLDMDMKQLENQSFKVVYRSLESQHITQYTKCDAWIYDKSVMKSSIVTEWNLICGQEIQIANTNLAYVLGYLLGTLTSGLISDRYGRAKTVIWGNVLAALVGIIMCEMTIFGLFLLFRFLLAFCLNAATCAAFVLVIETTTTNKHRQLVNSLYPIAYSCGYVMLAGIAYATREWRLMHLIIVVPLAINIVGIFLLPESPRWLVSKGRVEEAKVILRRAANLNGVKDQTFLKNDIEFDEAERSENFLHIFRYPTLVLRAAIMCFVWFVNALVYYGISLNVTSFVGDIFANNAICGVIELPAAFLSFLLSSYWGRRKCVCLALLISGSSLVPIPFVSSTGTMVFAMLGKLFITTSFVTIYIYTSELYPTVIRTAGLSLSSVIARVGSISAPYIILIGTTDPAFKAFPILFFGMFSIGAGLATLILPETRNKLLPTYLEDALKFENEDESIQTPSQPNYGATDDSLMQLIPSSDGDGIYALVVSK